MPQPFWLQAFTVPGLAADRVSILDDRLGIHCLRSVRLWASRRSSQLCWGDVPVLANLFDAGQDGPLFARELAGVLDGVHGIEEGYPDAAREGPWAAP